MSRRVRCARARGHRGRHQGGGLAAGGGGAGVPVRQRLPVFRVDDAGASSDRPRVHGQQRDAVAVGHGGVQADGAGAGADLDQLPVKHPGRRDRVQVGLERDQAVLADVAQIPVRHHIRPGRTRRKSGVIALGPHPDHLAMGAVYDAAAGRHPGQERLIQLTEGCERPARQHVIPHDRHLPLDPALPGGPVGRQHVDVKPVMPGERDRLGMQWHPLARRDVPAHHGLGPVIDDRAGHPAEMLKRPAMAGPERRQIHARGETAKRIPRIRQHHVERVHLADPHMGQDGALITPVHLGLGTRYHLEPAVQPGQLAGRIPQLGGDPGPGFLQIHLDPLVIAREPVLGHQPLVDHRALQQHLSTQPRINHRSIGGDDRLPQIRPRRGLGGAAGPQPAGTS